MENQKKQATDLILIQSVARIEEKLKVLEKHSNDINEIKKVLTSHRFQRLMLNANRIGDQEEIMRIISDDYYGIPGFKLFPIVLEKLAKDICEKKELKKSVIKNLGRWVVDIFISLPKTITTAIIVILIVLAYFKRSLF